MGLRGKGMGCVCIIVVFNSQFEIPIISRDWKEKLFVVNYFSTNVRLNDEKEFALTGGTFCGSERKKQLYRQDEGLLKTFDIFYLGHSCISTLHPRINFIYRFWAVKAAQIELIYISIFCHCAVCIVDCSLWMGILLPCIG